VAWAEVLVRSKTLAFLSSQSVRRTNMIKELAALRSLAKKRAVAAGHHSSRTTISDGQIGGKCSLVITPVQTARANGQRSER
jgi:hypothetical protein